MPRIKLLKKVSLKSFPNQDSQLEEIRNFLFSVHDGYRSKTGNYQTKFNQSLDWKGLVEHLPDSAKDFESLYLKSAKSLEKTLNIVIEDSFERIQLSTEFHDIKIISVDKEDRYKTEVALFFITKEITMFEHIHNKLLLGYEDGEKFFVDLNNDVSIVEYIQ